MKSMSIVVSSFSSAMQGLRKNWKSLLWLWLGAFLLKVVAAGFIFKFTGFYLLFERSVLFYLGGYAYIIPIILNFFGNQSFAMLMGWVVCYFVLALGLYAVFSFIAALVRNLLDVHDKKKLRGFKGFCASLHIPMLMFLLFFINQLVYGPLLRFYFVMNGGDFYLVRDLIIAVICCVGLYLATRLMFAYFIVVDTGCNAFAAMKKSWNITKNNWLPLLGVHFLALSIGSLSFPSLVLQVFFLSWYVYLYRAVSKK